MYSKIHSRLDWFFGYIGEPEEDFVVELYGDVNFDGEINVNDVIIMINFVLYPDLEDEYWTPTPEQFLTADMNQDGIINILDIVSLVSLILD